MQNKIIEILLLFYAIYLAVIGYLNIEKGKEIINIFSLAELEMIKIFKGMSAYEIRKSNLLEPIKHKIFSTSYLVTGIGMTFLMLYLLFT